MGFSKNISTALFLFLISAGIQAQTIENPKTIAINPGHFPTDKLGGTGAPGKDVTEYKLNLKMAEYIQEEFAKDPRLNIIMSKDKNGIIPSLIEDVNNAKSFYRPLNLYLCIRE